MFLRILLTIVVLGALGVGGVLVGCERQAPALRAEIDEPAYRRGESMLKEGRQEEALSAFEQVVDSRVDAAESHLELGRLYLDYVKDPVTAIYHFRKYLELRPKGEKSDLVKGLINTATKDFAAQLPAQPFGEQTDRLDLLDTIDTLRAENLDLKRQLAAAGVRATAHPAPAVTAAPAAARPTPSTFTPPPAATMASTPGDHYTVVQGDTLSSIARKVYGNPNRWQDIFNANRDQLQNANDLKLGMELKIPK